MEFLLNRYRNVTVLLAVLAAQLLLIAYQVKTSKDVPLIRVWAVGAVTPVEKALEFVRRNTWGLVEDYFVLLHVREENVRLKNEVGALKLNNHYLRAELSTADRARSLSAFQQHSPSKMLPARILGNGTGANSKVVFLDRGSGDGIESGMAVVMPDGIVGKIVAAYPTSSLVLLITDVNFAAGVISQKNRVHGTLKGTGHDGSAVVDYVQNEEKVEPGEWFYTSGDDRIFPRGFPVGQVTAVRNGPRFKHIYVSPSGFQAALEEVLVVLEAVHQPIPDVEVASPNYKLTNPPPGTPLNSDASAVAGSSDADHLKDQYRQIQHSYGAVGSPVPDFSKLPGTKEATPPPPMTAANPAAPQAVPPPVPKPADAADAGANAPAKPKAPPTDSQNGSPTAGGQPVAKPKTKAPLLVIDPTDADPSEPVISPPPPKPKPKNPQQPLD